MGRPPTPPEERFWKFVQKTNSCWLWTGGLNTGGYGNFRDGNSHQVGAHIFSYELVHGRIPPAHYLDHRASCPKCCVHPEHLRVVTNKQNQENRGKLPSNNTSGVLGVGWRKDRHRWVVRVRHNGELYNGGWHKNLAAAEAEAISLRNRLFTHNDLDRDA